MHETERVLDEDFRSNRTRQDKSRNQSSNKQVSDIRFTQILNLSSRKPHTLLMATTQDARQFTLVKCGTLVHFLIFSWKGGGGKGGGSGVNHPLAAPSNLLICAIFCARCIDKLRSNRINLGLKDSAKNALHGTKKSLLKSICIQTFKPPLTLC